MKFNFFKHIAAVALFFSVVSTLTKEEAKTIVLSFDIDDVVSSKRKIGGKEYLSLVGVFFRHPALLKLMRPANFRKVKREINKASEEINGSSNIIHVIVRILKEQGYGDLSDYEKQIVERAIKPSPIISMVEAIKQLKQQGYKVVGATNQDYKQYLTYRKKMKEWYNIDMNELFDAVLTTQVNHEQRTDENNTYYARLNSSENVYVALDIDAFKPHKKYFQALEQLVREKILPQVSEILHTDDSEENVVGAKKINTIKAVRFTLPASSALKTKPKDLQRTIQKWKKDLEQYYIVLK